MNSHYQFIGKFHFVLFLFLMKKLYSDISFYVAVSVHATCQLIRAQISPSTKCRQRPHCIKRQSELHAGHARRDT